MSDTPRTDAFLENALSAIHETETIEDFTRQLERELAAERERADRNQEDALTLMRALIKVRQQMFPQHDQRAVVSRDFPKLAAIDAARRK